MQSPDEKGAAFVQYVFDVLQDVPEWGLRAGDMVAVTYGGVWPVMLLREMPPNFGGVLNLLESGALEVRERDRAEATRYLRQRQAVQMGQVRLRLLPGPRPQPTGDDGAA